MVKGCCIVFLFVLFLSSTNTLALEQVAADLNFILYHNPIDPVKKDEEPSPFSFNQTNELKVSLMSLIRVYQLFVSTQDLSVCNFTPSCSRFGMRAIEEHGLLHGILMTSDRLQRCNGVGRKYYPVHPETGKCDDPVELNFLGNK